MSEDYLALPYPFGSLGASDIREGSYVPCPLASLSFYSERLDT